MADGLGDLFLALLDQDDAQAIIKERCHRRGGVYVTTVALALEDIERVPYRKRIPTYAGRLAMSAMNGVVRFRIVR
jgi:hypothetical protein